jgi:hypothetical protein
LVVTTTPSMPEPTPPSAPSQWNMNLQEICIMITTVFVALAVISLSIMVATKRSARISERRLASSNPNSQSNSPSEAAIVIHAPAGKVTARGVGAPGIQVKIEHMDYAHDDGQLPRFTADMIAAAAGEVLTQAPAGMHGTVPNHGLMNSYMAANNRWAANATVRCSFLACRILQLRLLFGFTTLLGVNEANMRVAHYSTPFGCPFPYRYPS